MDIWLTLELRSRWDWFIEDLKSIFFCLCYLENVEYWDILLRQESTDKYFCIFYYKKCSCTSFSVDWTYLFSSRIRVNRSILFFSEKKVIMCKFYDYKTKEHHARCIHSLLCWERLEEDHFLWNYHTKIFALCYLEKLSNYLASFLLNAVPSREHTFEVIIFIQWPYFQRRNHSFLEM